MTENRRIILNVIATYGRSLYGLLCGLFSTRWILAILGDSDYGLLGVVAGLSGFVVFFNGILSISVARYFAYSVGRSKIPGQESRGISECRQWFNTAFFLHSIFAVALTLAGYPLGSWAIRHFLTVPPDRLGDCIWLFRWVCVSCFVGMLAVPFQAMYTAKQLIAELTVYSFASTTANFLFLYFALRHPGDWLVRIGAWNCLIAVVPQILIAIRAVLRFDEIRFCLKSMLSLSHMRELGSFAGWYLFGMVGNLLRYQGMSVLVNKYFGPAQNAAVTVANNIAAQSSTLSGALVGAFSPAITNACGAGNLNRMMGLVYRAEKYGTILVLIFAIPMGLEMEYLLKLWLVSPPEFSEGLAILVIVTIVLEKIAEGHWIAISANGKIAGYQITVGSILVSTIFFAWGMMAVGMNVYAMGYAMALTLLMAVAVRVVMFGRIFSVSPLKWIGHVLLPVCCVALFATLVGAWVQRTMEPSLLRIVCVTVGTELVLVPLAWFFIDREDRQAILARIGRALTFGGQSNQ